MKESIRMESKSWSEIKDKVYGKKGETRRDKLDKEFESFKSLLIKKSPGRITIQNSCIQSANPLIR